MNKEDIEKVKKHYIFTTEHELDDDNKTLKEYIEYLEQKEFILDKVTEKLKEIRRELDDDGFDYYTQEITKALNIIERRKE